MIEKRLETGPNPEVVVEARGRLYLRGWEQREVVASGEDDSLSLELRDQKVFASCDDRMELRVPAGASLVVTVFDEATIRDLTGSLRVEHAADCLTLRNLADAEVQLVGNDLTARTFSGNLVVHQVGRFATVRDIAGDFSADRIGSHANVRGVAGNVRFATDGNANLFLDLREGSRAEVSSDGVITCRVAPGLNARVRLVSHSPISVRIGEEKAVSQEGTLEQVFGDGAAELQLTADGPITLVESRPEKASLEFGVNLDEDLSGLGTEIGEQLSEQLGMIEEELEARLAGLSDLVGAWGLSREKSERIHQRAQEKIDRAQEKIRKAQERAARRIADAQRRAEAESRRSERVAERVARRAWTLDLGDLRKTVKQKSDPVSDDERLMILNMVAEKKITLEEAEALLAALEGN